MIIITAVCSEVKNVFFKRKKVTFDKVAKFNYELDTNEKLKEELKNLALCRNTVNKTEYLANMLALFGKEGLDISLKELDMLLLFRKKTEQVMLERANDSEYKDIEERYEMRKRFISFLWFYV